MLLGMMIQWRHVDRPEYRASFLGNSASPWFVVLPTLCYVLTTNGHAHSPWRPEWTKSYQAGTLTSFMLKNLGWRFIFRDFVVARTALHRPSPFTMSNPICNDSSARRQSNFYRV